MAYVTEAEIRKAAREATSSWSRKTATFAKSASTVLLEDMEKSLKERSSFDVFLCHSIGDAELVLGAKHYLEQFGQSVYVDWIVDPSMDRTKVSAATAEKLRSRLKQCKSLLYLYSNNSQGSRWMPWELGFFDGHNGNVAIFPIKPDGQELNFSKEEYLGLYPKVDFAPNRAGVRRIFVNKYSTLKDDLPHSEFELWRNSGDKLRPPA